ncbi:unnamed protein product, partial [Phaeothamnion confervicola]
MLGGETCARLWRVGIEDNHGNTSGVALTGAQFLIAKEESPRILEQPRSVVAVPPAVGQRPARRLELQANATGWPAPTYQWYRNGQPLLGATQKTLALELDTKASTEVKLFRCVHCKHIKRDVPANCFRVVCGNCGTAFDYEEYEKAAAARPPLEEALREAEELLARREWEAVDARQLLSDMQRRLAVTAETAAAAGTTAAVLATPKPAAAAEAAAGKAAAGTAAAGTVPPTLAAASATKKAGGNNPATTTSQKPKRSAAAVDSDDDDADAKAEAEAGAAAAHARTAAAAAAADAALADAIEARERAAAPMLAASADDPIKIRHTAEGRYECRVANRRAGGTMINEARTRTVTVVAVDPPPLRVKVCMEYRARGRVRRRDWPKYTSVFGWFADGRIAGRVIVRYHDGSVYDGPYVDERWIDIQGQTVAGARADDHWGVWVTDRGQSFEGPLVDNHFDVGRVCGLFRIASAAGECYEGEMLDEARHGVGDYRYADGSAYRGEWFRGLRQGFGRLAAPDGTCYEGEWDHDVIHGDGRWSWPDGSLYIGPAQHGRRHGRGLYVTQMGDVYFGDFRDSAFDGRGAFHYGDGSRYVGEFVAGLRHGRGTQTGPDGTEHDGAFEKDERHGEFEVRTPVWVAEVNAFERETRRGLWEHGAFVAWLATPTYPQATARFCELFENDPRQYDGIYALHVARKLPLLPRGVAPDHPRVLPIVARLQAEAGELCACDTIRDAERQACELQPAADRAAVRWQAAQLARQLEAERAVKLETTVGVLDAKLVRLRENAAALQAGVERAFAEDPGQAKARFAECIAWLKTVSLQEWYLLKNYREPPPVVARVCSAFCVLLTAPDTWRSAQNLLSTAQYNRDHGDPSAIAVDYNCKLIHLVEKEWDVYACSDGPQLMTQLGMFVSDPRFKSDNAFLKLYGDGLVPLVDFVRAGYNYVLVAATAKPMRDSISGVLNNIKRTETVIAAERAALADAQRMLEERDTAVIRTAADKARADDAVGRARALLARARALVTVYREPRGPLDVYEALEQNLEADEAEMQVEVVLEQLVAGVEHRIAAAKATIKAATAAAAEKAARSAAVSAAKRAAADDAEDGEEGDMNAASGSVIAAIESGGGGTGSGDAAAVERDPEGRRPPFVLASGVRESVARALQALADAGCLFYEAGRMAAVDAAEETIMQRA